MTRAARLIILWARTRRKRHIGALISEFSSLGALLANSDLIGTFPRILMAWDMQTYGLRPLLPPVLQRPFRTRFFWSSRLANDPASMWIRDIVLQVYRDIHDEADRMVERELTVARV